MDVFINELQGIPVAGNDDALPFVVGADAAHGADDVVGFPALAFVNGDVHGPQDVLHHRHLHGQLFGHTMAVGLVAVVLQMAEGRAVQVEGHADRFRLFFLLHPFQNVQEAVNGMGVKPLPGGQGLYAEKGTVNDGVAV